MFDPNTGQNLDLDASLAHPWSEDIIRRASGENGHAATTREEKKMKKYSVELVPGRYVSRCVPLVIELPFWDVGHKNKSIFCSICHNSQ